MACQTPVTRVSTAAQTLVLTLALTLPQIERPLVAQEGEESAPPGIVGSEQPQTPRAVMEPDWTQPVSR